MNVMIVRRTKCTYPPRSRMPPTSAARKIAQASPTPDHGRTEDCCEPVPDEAWDVQLWLVTHVDLPRRPKVQDPPAPPGAPARRRLEDRREVGEGAARLRQIREADEVGDAGEGAPERLDLRVGVGGLRGGSVAPLEDL